MIFSKFCLLCFIKFKYLMIKYFYQVITLLTSTCSKSTIETVEKGVKLYLKLHRSSVFIANFEHTSNLFLVFLLLL